MINFEQFNKTINSADFNEKIKEATYNNIPVPKGVYLVGVEKMELGLTSTEKVIFKAQFKVLDGDYANRVLFFNRVISGTKNDISMISGLLTFLNDLSGGAVDTTILDTTKVYNEIDRIVNEVFEECKNFEFDVEYDEKAFNSIKILQ